ncbi:carbohydrate binding domain-containing protein [Paenibacillus albiflavus]|nr:carbohydrate binding domain-containing protein [Paenibacillus albiflavus]
MRIRLSIFLAVALLISSIMAGLPVIHAMDESAQPNEIIMVNPGFEEEVSEDGSIPGWTPNYTPVVDSVSHSISTEANSGSQSLNLFDNSNEGTVELVSDQYEVQPGNLYTLSAWINPNEPVGRVDGSVGGSIHLRFYDENRVEIEESRGEKDCNDNSVQGKFTQISTPNMMAPDNAKYVSAAVLITESWTGDTYFDDVMITYESPASEPEPTPTPESTPIPTPMASPTPPTTLTESTPSSGEITMINPGFEDAVGENGEIPGWTPNYTPIPNSVSHSVSTKQAKNGSQSLNLFDNSNTTGTVELVSDKYAVESGQIYTLSAWINPNVPAGWKAGSVGGSIQLRFYDESSKEITASRGVKHYSDTNAQGKFTQVYLENIKAPENAKYVSIALLITPVWTGDTYFDDLTLTYKSEVIVEPEEDLTEKVISSNGIKEIVSIPVPNAGFERNLNVDGTIQSWKAWGPSTDMLKYERSSQKAYTGKYSLKITDSLDTNHVVLESMPLAVKPGVEYTASAMMNIEDPNTTGATFLLRFFNAQNTQVGTDVLQHYKSPINEWYKAELKGLAPDGAKYAKILTLVNVANKAVVYYDDVMFTYERDLMNLDITAPEFAAHNQTFTVQLGATNASSLTGAELNLAFDTNALEFVEAAVHSDFSTTDNTTLSSNVNNGVLAIQVSKNGNEIVNGNVGIVNVKFKAKGDKGNTVLSLKAGSILKTVKNGAVESTTYPSDLRARITIMQYAEDVNHDGIVNLVDLLLVAKNVGVQLDSITKSYDLNNDGKIDAADVDLLLQALTTN